MSNELKELNYPHLQEKIYTKVLDNGLTVFINPKVGLHKANMVFMTNFGSTDITFIPKGESEFVTMPEGVAHFLEHKMFSMPGDKDASNMFAELGADSNAFTSYNETAYYATCNKNYKEVLELLLDFVQTPYFTEESVEKEKDIIIQELKMYQDNANDRVSLNLYKNLYEYNNHREDVVGTIDSIRSINKDILYTCYNTFYQPNNMYLSISGNVDVNETIKIIEENQSKKEFNNQKIIQRKYYLESPIVYKAKSKNRMNIVMPKLSCGIKLPVAPYTEDNILKLELISKILLEFAFGYSSDNYQFMLDTGLINGFSYNANFDASTSQVKFFANTNKPKELVKFMKHELFNLKDININENEFNYLKKGLIGAYIRALENVEFISINYPEYAMKNCDLFKNNEILNSITIDDLKEFAKEFTKDRFAYALIEPLKK